VKNNRLTGSIGAVLDPLERVYTSEKLHES